ncbi:efflux RND transporter periplasmic adaptor subunit [Pseudodesulfovibrio sediminis]|uniref:RND transporter n=1 Tax=Pseudodesulfovibrio sediminis TaxID=2810563 RepID=A0ABN6EQ69_9BACT|nr:efflux RND transporter periplasmic adaptor subunit [Pseudodesulfovibrio sediminis]BCS88591.1 RND transporter [Pseudodesulfovibrio sediminis]
MKKLIFILIAVLITGGGIWYFKGTQSAGKIKVLKTTTIQRGSVTRVLEATGIVKAQVGAQVKIGAQATGVLESVPVKVGDHVNKGDLIAQIDARELRARISEAQANLDQAQAKLRYMQKNLPRQRALVQKHLAAQDTLDVAMQDADMARHAVASSKAIMRTLQVQLTYTKIYSPITGVVSQVAAQEGETIVSGLSVSNLITVLDPTKLEMWIYIDETDVGRVQEGLPVRYTVDAYRDRIFEGVVARIYPEPEIRDNIVYYRTLVKVTEDQSEYLRPEMTTQCKIIVETKDDVLTVPNTALKWVRDRQVCFVVGPDPKVEPTEVLPTLGLVGLESSEVLEGLSEGDTVATQLVLPGAKVGKKGI